MNKKLKEQRLIELLHDCTQMGYRLTFSNDFEGMITIGFEEEYTEGTYNHVHLGTPGKDLNFLEKELRNFLAKLIEVDKTQK